MALEVSRAGFTVTCRVFAGFHHSSVVDGRGQYSDDRAERQGGDTDRTLHTGSQRGLQRSRHDDSRPGTDWRKAGLEVLENN